MTCKCQRSVKLGVIMCESWNGKNRELTTELEGTVHVYLNICDDMLRDKVNEINHQQRIFKN